MTPDGALSFSTMMPLGEFREFGPWPASFPSINDAASHGVPTPTHRWAALYLAGGVILGATMDRGSPDVIDGETVWLSSSWLTDGDWFWHEHLAHYVLKYRLDLPPTFIHHAESYAWSTGSLSDQRLGECAHEVLKFEKSLLDRH